MGSQSVRGQRHAVKCRCILHQLKSSQSPPRHQFVVFSLIDGTDNVVPKTVRCNNCGILHRVTDLGKSQIMSGREDSLTLTTIDDIRVGLDPRLAGYLDSIGAELHVWEHVKHIIDTQAWGSHCVVATEKSDGMREGKYIRVLSPTMFTVESFSEEIDLG